MILFHYFKMSLLLSFRPVEYHLDGLFYDPMKLKNCDFSNSDELHTFSAADRKRYSIFDHEYWNEQ